MPRVEVDAEPAIKALYDAQCVMTGEFLLRSGASSSIYWNLRNLRSFPRAKATVVDTYVELLKGIEFDHIAGAQFNHVVDVPTAASPLVASIADRLQISQLTPRTGIKDHGISVPVDGVFKEDDLVVPIDDLITSGTSIIEAVEVLRAAKLRANDVVVLMDRMMGGEENLKAKGLRLHYAFTMREALESLADNPTVLDKDRRKFEVQANLT